MKRGIFFSVGLLNPVFITVCVGHIIMLMRNLGYNAYRRTAYIREVVDIPAVARGIRIGIPPGNLANELCKGQARYITAESCAGTRSVFHQRVKLFCCRPDTQITTRRNFIVEFVFLAFGHLCCVEYIGRQQSNRNKVFCLIRDALLIVRYRRCAAIQPCVPTVGKQTVYYRTGFLQGNAVARPPVAICIAGE